MRYLISLILTCLLFSNSIWAQESEIPQEKWNAIVDYTNAKVTLAYIESYHKTNKPNKEDNIYFEDTLKPILTENHIESPTSFNTLRTQMAPHFQKTFNNLTSTIEGAKKKSRVLDTLYNTLQAGLKKVQKEEIYNSHSIQILKSEINEFLKDIPNEKILQIDDSNWNPTETRSKTKLFTLSNIIMGVLILLLVILIIMVIAQDKTIKSQKNKLERVQKGPQSNELNTSPNPQFNERSESRFKELERKLRQAEEDNKILVGRLKRETEPDVISQEIDLGPPNPLPISTTFYSGKPTPDRKFLEVTDKIRDQETIFKFTFTDSSRTKASFEVILASDFMKRQITNAPDDFLYRVCNNTNTNQDFRREIITERKGIAHLRNDVWAVDEDDKALIRFQ